MPSFALLKHLHGIEARFGRRRGVRWGARTLDLDLLGSGGLIRPGPQDVRAWMDLSPAHQMERTPTELLLPHPRLQDRAFVLIPLAQIAPQWRHPVTGRSVATMLGALPASKRQEIRPIGPVDGVVNRNLRA